MLHPWSNSVTLSVQADRIAIQPVRPTVVAQSVVVQVNGAQAIGGGDCSTMAEAIRDALSQIETGVRRRMPTVHVEIADDFAYYDVVAADCRDLSGAVLRRLAAAALADTFGLDPAALTTRYSVQQGGLSMVACGFHSSLLDAISGALRAARCRSGRVEPAFAAFLDRNRKSLASADAIVARESDGHLMLALLDRGLWHAFCAERMEPGSWEDMRARCDAFARRLCVSEPERRPVWFEADVGELPVDPGLPWYRLGAHGNVTDPGQACPIQ